MTRDLKEIWRTADAVCFDVDSTVSTSEGIDDLAAYLGVGDQVAELTRKAMGEGLSFRQALQQRLALMDLSKKKLDGFLATDPSKLTPGIKELVDKLHSQDKQVFLVSGGFYSLIKPLADQLNVSNKNIIANRFIFDEQNNFVGFDEEQPTSSSGGKKVVVEKLKQEKAIKQLVMIGDGMTDLEAYPPADLFIGFGGNRIRENVRKNSPWFVTDFQTLIDCL